MSETILSLTGITKRFGGVTALNNVNLEVKQGEVVGLMGPNGAGKTTLLNIIAGDFPPDSGKIIYKGEDITGHTAYKSPKIGIARTFQIPLPFVSLSVRDNLRAASTFGLKHGQHESSMDFDKVIELAGLQGMEDTITGNLPTLSLKRLELARALSCDPDLLLMDEVAAGLTDPEIPRILDTIKQINEMGKTIIIIEHVMKVLVGAVERICCLDKGENLCEGCTDDIMEDDRVVEAYFGCE